jgi:hypothetical protein
MEVGTGGRMAYGDTYAFPYVFVVRFTDGLSLEIVVNEDYGSLENARREAEKYPYELGQLPRALRSGIQDVYILKGSFGFGGGLGSIQIHAGSRPEAVRLEAMEEVFLHEGVHASLDVPYGLDAPGWVAAQAADAGFISTYARDFPRREDMAESFPVWVALRYRPDRLTETARRTIEATIPNRLAYFDSLYLDMRPISPTGPTIFASHPLLEGFRNTAKPGTPGMGWIYDAAWPQVYSYALGRWLYFLDDGSPAGFYAYEFELKGWIWGSVDWGWYFDFDRATWERFIPLD